MATKTPYLGAAVAGEILTAANLNKGNAGYLDLVTSSSNSSSTSGTTELTFLTSDAVTPVAASRVWRVTLWARGIDPTASGDLFIIRLYDGASVIADAHYETSNLTQGAFPSCVAIISNVAVSAHTFTGRIVRSAGAGTVAVTATATSPMYILVEDLGSVS